MGGLWDEIRASWAANRPRRPVHVTGELNPPDPPGVIELTGLDRHRPVRPPQKWREVTIFGRRVYVKGHDAAPFLLECPLCAALVVGDQWAKSRHQEVCSGLEPAAELPAAPAKDDRTGGHFTEETGDWA